MSDQVSPESGAGIASSDGMHAASPPSVSEGLADDRRVSDVLARAVLAALLDSASVGVALVRSDDGSHMMASATYERLLGVSGIVGRPLSDVLPASVAPRSILDAVASSGDATTTLLEHAGKAGTAPIPMHLSFTFFRARHVTPDSDGVLVLVQDVSREVHEQRVGELFVTLASDMSAQGDEKASVRSSVAHAARALGADAASIFLLSPDGKRLHGALVGWDWTRTSFVAELENWPNVARAIASNASSYLTAEVAARAEEVWFERRGIKAAICAPMAARGRVLGVLFFDYVKPLVGQVDLTLAKSVADQCALLVEHAARPWPTTPSTDATSA